MLCLTIQLKYLLAYHKQGRSYTMNDRCVTNMTWYLHCFSTKLADVLMQKSPIDPIPTSRSQGSLSVIFIWSVTLYVTDVTFHECTRRSCKRSICKNLALGCTSGVYNRGRVYFWGRPAGSLTCWGFRVNLRQSGGDPGEEQLRLCSSLIEIIPQSGVLMRGQRGQRM